MSDALAWLRAQLDDDERVALEASRDGEHGTPTGEHWHWVESEHDQVLTLDPMLDEYVNDGSRAALRSVEEYPTSMPYTLPHFIVSTAEEVPTVCGMHIARWDPARVLAEIEAKRRILDDHEPLTNGACDRCSNGMWSDSHQIWPCTTVRLLAQPYADRPGFPEEWR